MTKSEKLPLLTGFVAVVGGVAALASPSTAAARTFAQAETGVRGTVALVCRVEANPGSGGEFQLSEMCNSAGGYQVSLQSDDLQGGEILIDGAPVLIEADDQVITSSATPSWRTRRLRFPASFSDHQPVVAFTITPR